VTVAGAATTGTKRDMALTRTLVSHDRAASPVASTHAASLRLRSRNNRMREIGCTFSIVRCGAIVYRCRLVWPTVLMGGSMPTSRLERCVRSDAAMPRRPLPCGTTDNHRGRVAGSVVQDLWIAAAHRWPTVQICCQSRPIRSALGAIVGMRRPYRWISTADPRAEDARRERTRIRPDGCEVRPRAENAAW